MSDWDNLKLEDKIVEVLDIPIRSDRDPNHHFGRPFMTPYQIAIRFSTYQISTDWKANWRDRDRPRFPGYVLCS